MQMGKETKSSKIIWRASQPSLYPTRTIPAPCSTGLQKILKLKFNGTNMWKAPNVTKTNWQDKEKLPDDYTKYCSKFIDMVLEFESM